MSNARPHPVGTMSPHRIEALSDGVFAIVMTLLVFDITLPDVPPNELPAALVSLWPNFLGYGISFVLLGIYWVGHRNQYNYIRHADQNLHWLNILFFAFAALVPFSTGLVSRYPGQQLAISIYGLNLILIGVSLYFHWRYATHHRQLVDEDIPQAVVRLGTQRCLLAPAGYLVAVAVGLVSPLVSLILYATVPLLYIVPSLQRLWAHLAHR